MTNFSFLFTHSNLDIDNHLHCCLAIAFDYLIIGDIAHDYDYFKKLLNSNVRKKLFCLNHESNDLTRKLCLEAQQRDMLNYEIGYKIHYSFSWCHFVRNQKYLANYKSWAFVKTFLDKYAIVNIVDSNMFTYAKSLSNQIKDKLEFSLTKHKIPTYFSKCITFGFLEDNHNFKSFHNYYTTYQALNIKQKKTIRIAKTKLSFYQKFEEKKYKKVFQNKFHTLKQLILNKRICEFPSCNKCCFKPHSTCHNHRYMNLFKDDIIKPTVFSLLKLDSSIVII